MSYSYYEGQILIQSNVGPLKVVLNSEKMLSVIKVKAFGYTELNVMFKLREFLHNSILSQHDYMREPNYDILNMYVAIFTLAEGLKCSDYITSASPKQGIVSCNIMFHENPAEIIL